MPKIDSKSDLKKQIRSTTRLLKKKEQTLTATQLSEIQRKLAFLKTELSATESTTLEQKLFNKYKMVKFIELKKSSRNVKQLQTLIVKKGGKVVTNSSTATTEKSIEEDLQDDESKYTQLSLIELEQALILQTQNVNYINHYPKDFKYVSLFTVDPKSLLLVEEIKSFIAGKVAELKEGQELVIKKKDVFGDRKVDDKVEEEKDDFFM